MRIGRGLRLIATIATLTLIPAPAAVASGTTAPVEITDPAYVGKVGLDQGVCFEWMLYGVRGSGEPALQGAGIGATLKVVHLQLSRMMKFRDKLGSAFPVDYLALPVSWDMSTEKAKEWWSQQVFNNKHANLGLRALSLTCPNSKILLAGYSQGAIAVSSSYRVLAKDSSDPILAKVRGAFLVGNPSRNSNKALLKQLDGICNGRQGVENFFSLYREACFSQTDLLYDNLATKTPTPKSGFRVREFNNKNDLVADYQIRRPRGARLLPVTVELLVVIPAFVAEEILRFNIALASHKNYTDKNRSFVNAIRRFSSEVR